MLAAAATFPSPPLTMAAFLATITDYIAKNVARASKATDDRMAFEQARQVLEDALTQLGNYVNIVAMRQPVTVDLSGFPSYTTRACPTFSRPPPRPTCACGRAT